MAGGLVAAGLAVAGGAFAVRALLRNQKAIGAIVEAIPGLEKYPRGGFEKAMSRREAAQILGIPAAANSNRIKDAHKRVMILNHPDRGGSPYLAAKINEAKELLESGGRSSSGF